MPSHTPEEQIKALINPMAGLAPGRNINPILGSQAPPPQQQLGPVAQPQAPPPQPPAPAPQVPTGGGGLFASLFGGQQGQDLSTKSRKQLGRDALFNAGLSLLEQTPDAQGFSPTSLQGLGRSLRAGRESFGAGVADERAQAALAEREKLLLGADDPESRRSAFQEILERAVISGDPDLVSNMKSALDALPDPDKFDYETADSILYQFDKNGNMIAKFGGGEKSNILGVLTDRQFDRIKVPLTDFNQSTRGVREVPTQFLRVVASATPLARLSNDEFENMTLAEKKRLSFAAVSALSSYARLIDPNSVVRTSEMDLLLEQGSWKEKLETLMLRALEGTMSPRLANALIEEAKAQTKAQKVAYENFINEFTKTAEAFAGLAPEQSVQLLINPYAQLDIDNPPVPSRTNVVSEIGDL